MCVIAGWRASCHQDTPLSYFPLLTLVNLPEKQPFNLICSPDQHIPDTLTALWLYDMSGVGYCTLTERIRNHNGFKPPVFRDFHRWRVVQGWREEIAVYSYDCLRWHSSFQLISQQKAQLDMNINHSLRHCLWERMHVFKHIFCYLLY